MALFDELIVKFGADLTGLTAAFRNVETTLAGFTQMFTAAGAASNRP